jgi:hypothetical protein
MAILPAEVALVPPISHQGSQKMSRSSVYRRGRLLAAAALPVLASFAMVALLPQAQAAPLIFFGEDADAGASLPVPNAAAAQAAFLGQLIGVSTQSFEGLATGTQFPIAISFGADTATLSGTNTPTTRINDSPNSGRFAISGSKYLNIGENAAGTFTLTFSTPQSAFGFFATDIGDVGGQLALQLDGGALINVPHTLDAPSGAALYFGIIDTANPFTTVTFRDALATFDDAFGFDDFTIGRREQVVTPPPGAVPTPGTLALLAPALGLAWLRRLNRRMAA